jgi:hypothetical protein
VANIITAPLLHFQSRSLVGMPSAKVRVGNWQEELAYEADRKALVAEARGAGATLSQRILAKVRHHRQRVELQDAPADGYLRFHRPIALQNADTQGCLATDLDDKSLVGAETRFAATTATLDEPQLRSSWILLPVPSNEDAFIDPASDPEVVHYGQRFVIQSLDNLRDEPLFLSSGPKTHTNLSRVTSNQDVFFTEKGGRNAIWFAVHANGEFRQDMTGKPIKANALVLLNHQATNTPLASTSTARVANDFGAEYEVCASRILAVRSKSGSAPELPANLWAFVTAPLEK